jgi:hypothetical protein
MKRLFTVPGFGGGDTPAAPPPPPPPPEPPKKADPAVKQAREDERRRQRLQSGIGGTNVTGGQALGGTTAAKTQKTLLGN